MNLNRSNLSDFGHFLAIARHGNFTRAALDQGVSPSALSHSLKGLERRLGVRLLNRTNRSVTLTAAGEEFYASLSGPFDAISIAVEALNRFRAEPTGRIRLNVMEAASSLLLAPILPRFLELYPDIEVEVRVSNDLVDVIGKGFDAGIRYGGTVPEGMIARRLSADIRWLTVAATPYLDRAGTPTHPHDLAQHRCFKIRLGNDAIYNWEFERGSEAIAVAVPGPVTIDNADLAIAMARQGVGLAYLPEPFVRPYIARGELTVVLEDWAPMGEGFHIYYSGRHQLPVGLRLFMDLIRDLKPLGL